MSDRAIRDRWTREMRLDETVPHCLRLSEFIDRLREEPSQQRNGHGGVLLMRTSELHSVLETMSKDGLVHEHDAHGPVFVYVLEGELELWIAGKTLTAGPGELIALPRDQPRRLRALEATSLLWVIARASAPRTRGSDACRAVHAPLRHLRHGIRLWSGGLEVALETCTSVFRSRLAVGGKW